MPWLPDELAGGFCLQFQAYLNKQSCSKGTFTLQICSKTCEKFAAKSAAKVYLRYEIRNNFARIWSMNVP